MEVNFIGLYLVLFIIVGMIAYAGVEGTMDVFVYLNLQLRLVYINFRKEIIKFRLKRDLDKMRNSYLKDLEKLNDK
jgi:O-antigen ligase